MSIQPNKNSFFIIMFNLLTDLFLESWLKWITFTFDIQTWLSEDSGVELIKWIFLN